MLTQRNSHSRLVTAMLLLFTVASMTVLGIKPTRAGDRPPPPPSTAPTITSLSATTVVAGSPDLTLTVTGTNYVSASQVFFGGMPLTTTFVSATQLTAVVPAAAIASPKTVPVFVYDGAHSGAPSNFIRFSVTPANAPAPPAVTSLSPTTAVAGSAAFTLTVTGTGFVTGSVIYFGDHALVTTFVSAT